MKYLLVIIIAVLVSHVFGVQNGQEVTLQNRYPFYVMIGNPHVCGGTLISYDPALVLTAAHCIDAPIHPTEYAKGKSPYFALYNDIHREKQKTVTIVDWYIHPLYNVSGIINVRYDTAIVRLETPLKKSARIKRAPFWSPNMTLALPSKAELIGFGYTNSEGHMAESLQLMPLDITKFDPSGQEYIESKSITEDHVACHGDSGGPLIVYYTVFNPSTKRNTTVPYVLGDLTRIFGARDISPDHLTCPIAIEANKHSTSSSENTVTEVFTNVASFLDWVSSVSGISQENLSNPFYTPPHPPCENCRYKNKSDSTGKAVSQGDNGAGYYDDDDDDEVDEADFKKGRPQWRIGVATEDNGLLDTDESQHFWIGPIAKDFLSPDGPEESSAPTITIFIIPYTHIYILLWTLLLLFSSYIHY